jgi:hypothetical protein
MDTPAATRPPMPATADCERRGLSEIGAALRSMGRAGFEPARDGL